MDRIASIIVGIVACSLVGASPQTKDRNDAAAAIALAKARAKSPTVAAATKHIPYADAVKLAKQNGKPIVVVVGMECRHLCPSLRPEMLTAHEREFEGSSKPRVVLLIPGKDGSIYRVQEWSTLPKESEIKSAAQSWAGKVGQADIGHDADLLTALMIGMVAVQPADCPNGQCPVQYASSTSPAAGASSMVYESPAMTVNNPAASLHFAARFPRVAAFRGRMRAAVGLPAPRVMGGFYTVQMPAMQAEQPLPVDKPVPVESGPKVVGADAAGDDLTAAMESETGHRFRSKLKEYKLGQRFQILAAARAIQADGGGKWVDVLKTLLDLMITYGPKLLELLKLFGII